jgi:hypothetical protein
LERYLERGREMIVYILWAFFVGDMAPAPHQLSEYSTRIECEEQKEIVRNNVSPYWRYSCLRSKK